MRKRPEFTEQENEIIRNCMREPLWGFAQFTDYFCRDEDTGTWFMEEEDDYMYDTATRYGGGQRSMYEYLYNDWAVNGKPGPKMWADPPQFATYYTQSIEYEVTIEKGMPMFFWRHGWIPLKWGAIMHYAKQPDHTVLGGFGSSKTAHVGMSAFAYCCCVRRFRAVCVAGFLSNAKPMFQEIKNNVEETRAQQFVLRARSGDYRWSESPYPSIKFINGSEMVFMGADRDIHKVRSESGDWYIVEQSESHSDLGAVTLELGTRTRGRVRGRKRLGRMTFIANSGESPDLWERFDASEDKPQTYFSYNLTSYDNPHLSDADMERLERACGDDVDMIDQYMRGMKPIGRFKDFPRDVVMLCEDKGLDSVMAGSLASGNVEAKERIVKGVGHVEWSLPPAKHRDYAVYGDPGTMNPPYRGCGVTIVMDETDFPNNPAKVVHFKWTEGNGKIGPWLDDFAYAMARYNCQGRAYYEGTGDQKNLDELSFQDRKMIVQRVNMQGVKHGMKLKLLRLMERGMIRWAKTVTPIRIQFSKYDEYFDKKSSKLPQDIVMVFFIIGNELSSRMIETGGQTQQNVVKKAVRGPGGIRRARKVTKRYSRRRRG